MSVKEISKLGKKYELVAPDGGWGYIIWIAVIINMVSIGAFVACYGMIYNELYLELGMNSTAITLLNAVCSISVSVAALITSPLLNLMTLRRLGVVAAIMFNIGSFGVVFVHSRVLLFLCFGVIQSMGTGILYNITCTILNAYFVKKRMLSITMTQTITAIAALFSSQFVNWSAGEYGHRGTLILISAVYVHIFVAIALMQPVEWHMKKMEITEGKETEMKPLIINEEDLKGKLNIPTVKLSDVECAVNVGKDQNDGNIKEELKTHLAFKDILKDFMDVPFLKSFLLSNASVGLATSVVSDIIFVLMLPQSLYSMGWTESDVAWAIFYINVGDLAMKVIFILFNNFLNKFGSHEIYVVGLIITFFARIGLLCSNKPTAMLIFIAVIGISRSTVVMLIPLVIAEAVSEEKFTSAMGIYMVVYGTTYVILGPTIGAVRDLTNSYGTALYIVTSCFAIVAIFWSIELLYKKNKHKRTKK